jgi:hypothetical protein
MYPDVVDSLTADDYIALSFNFWAPTGKGEVYALASPGLHNWTFIPQVAYTKVVPQYGLEFDAVASVGFYSLQDRHDFKCKSYKKQLLLILQGNHLTESEMTGDNKTLNYHERAELLCFLVMAQLIAHASTGKWLRTDHAVEAGRIWMASNSADCDWFERAKLIQLSENIAPTFLVFPCFREIQELLKLLADGWQLDYRLPTVRGMLDVCTQHLMHI